MEGFPKPLLRDASGETLLARTLRIVRDAGLEPVLVGKHPAIDIASIADVAAECGPLGGLVALLEHAAVAVAVACDMPWIDAASLRALAARAGPIVAARRDGRWEPLFARYEAARVLPIARARLAKGQLALQGLLDAVGAVPFADACILHDVDTVLDASRAGLLRNHP